MKWILLAPLVFLMIACDPDRERTEAVDHITELEGIFFGDSVAVLDPEAGTNLMQAYLDFTGTYPGDSLSPEYLFKCAEIAQGLRQTGQALSHYQRVINEYPEHEKASYSLFMKAFIYENTLMQLEQAKRLYQEFVDLYPDHELAEDARVSIEYMGKPLEELIKSWEEKNQE